MLERAASLAGAAGGGEPHFSTDDLERSGDIRAAFSWTGWRLRLLVLAALLASLAVATTARLLAVSPLLLAEWQVTAQQQLMLHDSPERELHPYFGRTLTAMSGADGQRFEVDALALQRSPRWQVDDERRRRQITMQQRMAAAFAAGRVNLHFSDGDSVEVDTQRRGIGGLGLLFVPLSTLALALMLLGSVVVLARPQLRNGLYFVMALCQGIGLLFVAVGSARCLGMPTALLEHDMLLRMALDGVTAAAAVHAFAVHPRRLPQARLIAVAAWTSAAAVLLLAGAGALASLWWWAQGLALGLGAASLAVVSVSYRAEPNPFAAVMRRIGAAALATLALATLAVAAAASEPGAGPQATASIAATVWAVFFASLLLLLPFLDRARQLLREFALLAGIGTVAVSLDLLFVAVFALGPVASPTLAALLALAVYAAARQWILNQMAGSGALTTERAFEQLYRVAREIQEHPHQRSRLSARLLRELFEPVEVLRVERPAGRARVVGGGSALLVPMPRPGVDGPAADSLLLRFARGGQRLFTQHDARLADRVVDQLHRVVAYDLAVERGRSEERLRIAQDLHDDIGARLLTLMYQAPTPAIEDYLRDTLKDLKTLTRGLARSEHRLSHAAAEWKADIAQRLAMVQIELGWSFDIDEDLLLSMMQWSALTRVLRELVSNIIVHASATRVDIVLRLQQRRLRLSITDDGRGRQPAAWSNGLGLGGVRKRVKLLGGEVRWRENLPRGIVCEVEVAEFGPRR